MASSQSAPVASAHPPLGSLGRRIAAYALDLLIALSVLLLVALTMRALRAGGLWTPGGLGDPESTWKALGVGAKLLILVSFFLSTGSGYFILFEASPWQATFGKRLLDVYVTDDAGGRITLARSFGRSAAKWGFGWFGGSLVSLVTIAATRRKKALHDAVANTLVVRGQPMSGENLEAWRLIAAFGLPFICAFGLPFIWMMGSFVVTM